MPLPQFRNVGPTVLRQGRLGDAVQAPIWTDAAACHNDQTFVTGHGIPRYRNVGPSVLRQGRVRDGIQSPIWFDAAAAHDDQTFFVPNAPALCDVGPMVQRQGRKRAATQSPIWLDQAAPRDDRTHWLFRMVPNPFVGPMALRRVWAPRRTNAGLFNVVAPVHTIGSVPDIGVSDSAPLPTIGPLMNSYLLGVPYVKITAAFADDDGFSADPSTVQLRVYRDNVLLATLAYPTDTYLGQAITRASQGSFAFRLMAPPIAAYDYSWDTTGPVRVGDSSFKVIKRKH